MRKAVATQWVNYAAVENTNGFFHLKPLRAIQLPFLGLSIKAAVDAAGAITTPASLAWTSAIDQRLIQFGLKVRFCKLKSCALASCA